MQKEKTLKVSVYVSVSVSVSLSDLKLRCPDILPSRSEPSLYLAVCFSFISKMFPALPSSGAFPPSMQMLPPVASVPNSFWQGGHVGDHLRNLEDTIDLFKAVQKELDMILLIKRSNGFREEENKISPAHLPENISVSSSEASIHGDVFQTKRDNLALMRMLSFTTQRRCMYKIKAQGFCALPWG